MLEHLDSKRSPLDLRSKVLLDGKWADQQLQYFNRLTSESKRASSILSMERYNPRPDKLSLPTRPIRIVNKQGKPFRDTSAGCVINGVWWMHLLLGNV